MITVAVKDFFVGSIRFLVFFNREDTGDVAILLKQDDKTPGEAFALSVFRKTGEAMLAYVDEHPDIRSIRSCVPEGDRKVEIFRKMLQKGARGTLLPVYSEWHAHGMVVMVASRS